MSVFIDQNTRRGKQLHVFPFLSHFHDDVVSNILSFVAEAPFEQVHPRLLSEGGYAAFAGSLTHTLPLVCKAFYTLCRTSNQYWLDAIVRQMRANSDVWRRAILRILEGHDTKCLSGEKRKCPRQCSSDGTTLPLSQVCKSDMEAVEMACRVFCEMYERKGNDLDNSTPSFNSDPPFPLKQTCPGMSLYQYIITNDLKFSGSIFFMPQQVQLGHDIPLHFFEQRYRFLIAEVMRGFLQEYKQGALIPMDALPSIATNEQNPNPHRPPQFIFGTDAPLRIGAAACVVQVRQCVIRRDGTADVLLVPLSYGWFQSVVQRPGTAGLLAGTLIKMDPYSSQQREHSVHLWELQQRQHFHRMMQPSHDSDRQLDEIQSMLQELVHGVEHGEMEIDRRRDIIERLASTGIMVPDHLVSAAAAHANEVDDDI